MMKYILTTLLIFILADSSFAQIAVIANKSVNAGEVTNSQLYDFYTGDIREWEDGQSVVVFDLKPKSDIKDRFYEYLGTSTTRIKSIWLKKMYAGEQDPPDAALNEEEMIKKVAKTPGAVGFIPESMLNDRINVLLIIPEKEE